MSERARVKTLLREAGIEQQELAEELGVDPTHLSHVLAGRRPFSRQLARGFAFALERRGLTVDADALRCEPVEPSSAA